MPYRDSSLLADEKPTKSGVDRLLHLQVAICQVAICAVETWTLLTEYMCAAVQYLLRNDILHLRLTASTLDKAAGLL